MLIEKSIILFGVPRSGTTWLSEILTYKNDIKLVHEPDNEHNSFLGLFYKQGYSRFPYIRMGDSSKQINTFFNYALFRNIVKSESPINQLLFKIYNQSKNNLNKNLTNYDTALFKTLPFSNVLIKMLVGKPHHCRVLIKTVHSLLLLPYLNNEFDIIPVVIKRHPLNVFSSYIKMNMPDRDRALYHNEELMEDYSISVPVDLSEKSSDFRAGFQLGVFNKVINSFESSKELNEAVFLDYEQIISNPFVEIESLCKKLSIKYSADMEQFMKDKFKEGVGYQTNRVITGYDRIWEKRLSAEQIKEFLEGYARANGAIDFNH